MALDVIFDHYNKKSNDEYEKYRMSSNRLTQSKNYFLQKHNLEKWYAGRRFLVPNQKLIYKIINKFHLERVRRFFWKVIKGKLRM